MNDTPPRHRPATADEIRTPRRIQRQRVKGWRMPPGAIFVGRPSMWGNPWPGAVPMHANSPVDCYRWWLGPHGDAMPPPARADIRSDILRRLGELRGRDLACWCPLDQPCHADVLLALANAPLRCEGV